MVSVGITGLGSALPEKVITNFDLEKLVDTNDEWITQRTGIQTRRAASKSESLPVLMSVAATRALRDANLSARDIDYIICATNCTDPMLIPHLAPRVQYLIGAKEIPCFDVIAGCSGPTYATEVAVRTIRDRKASENKNTRVLMIGGDNMLNVTPMDDRNSLVLLADGAGACVFDVEQDDELGVRYVFNGADGSEGNLIHYESGFDNQLSSRGLEARTVAPGHFLMEGGKVHEFILKRSTDAIKDLVKGAGYDLSVIERAIIDPHQMNLRSIQKFIARLKRDTGYEPKMVYTDGIVNHGNNSTASTLVGLDELYRGQHLDLGDPLMMVVFGAGLTWGGTFVAWNKPRPSEKIEYDNREYREMLVSFNAKYDSWKEGLAKRKVAEKAAI